MIIDKKKGFVLGVILLSVGHLIGNSSQVLELIYPLKTLTSLVGICGGIFYFLNKKWSSFLLMFWAYSQVIIIEPIWNTAQIYEFDFSFYIEANNGNTYSIGVNILGLIYSGLAKLVFLNSFIGKEIKIAAFKKDSFLASFLPSNFTVEKVITLDDEKNWFLIKENSVDDPKYALVKPKNPENLKPKKINQILYFRIVPDVNLLSDKNKKEDFKTGGFVKITK